MRQRGKVSRVDLRGFVLRCIPPEIARRYRELRVRWDRFKGEHKTLDAKITMGMAGILHAVESVLKRTKNVRLEGDYWYYEEGGQP